MNAYGLHPAHDAARAAHELRHAVRKLSNTAALPEHVADMTDVIAKALDHYWWQCRVRGEAMGDGSY